ncbi:tyrosine-type recombinase/integrase [Bifidobacterium pullorum]|nr:tyrosine-type recombinase/integrase [Bifidobacterium pullorum]
MRGSRFREEWGSGMKYWSETRRNCRHAEPLDCWREPVDQWLDYLDVIGRSRETQRTRWYQICEFSRFVGKGIPDVTEDDLVVCLARLNTESRRGMRSCIKTFYDWCIRHDLAEYNPAVGIPAVRTEIRGGLICPEDAVARGLSDQDEYASMAVMLGAFCGLRRIEMTRINLASDLEETPNGLELIIHGKGNRERKLPVPQRLAVKLSERPQGWLFPGDVHGHCGVDFVAKRIKKATGFPSHALRRRFATVAYYRSGCNIILVSKMLGHANIGTTMHYIGLVQDEMRNAIEATTRTDPTILLSPTAFRGSTDVFDVPYDLTTARIG